MFFFFTCGTHDFSSNLKGYENVRCQCPRCHNPSLVARKRRQFFTFCFIPVFPISWGKEMRCGICGYSQDTNEQQLNQYVGQMSGGPVAPQHQWK